MLPHSSRHLLAPIALGALLVSATPARALVVHVDTFTVTKNGATLFQDTFSDGIAPPSAPAEFASYIFTRGIGVESGGLLQLLPGTASVTATAQGTPSQTARATLATNVVPTDLTNGLKSSPMTFSVTAVFTLVAPATGDSYGIRLADRAADGTFQSMVPGGTLGDDVVDLQVIRSNTSGNPVVRFRSSEFVSGVVDSTSQTVALPTGSGADRIALTLSRSDPATNVITASYALFSGDTLVGSAFNFANTETIFSNENWTRAEFLASQLPIPEPEAYALMLAGIGLIGWNLRRKAKRVSAGRFA